MLKLVDVECAGLAASVGRGQSNRLLELPANIADEREVGNSDSDLLHAWVEERIVEVFAFVKTNRHRSREEFLQKLHWQMLSVSPVLQVCVVADTLKRKLLGRRFRTIRSKLTIATGFSSLRPLIS